MKKRLNLYILALLFVFVITSVLASSCSSGVSGKKILSDEPVKGREIVTLKVTFFDDQNRLKSPMATITSGNENEKAYIQDFRNIIMKAKGITISDEDNFSPISDSSHYIEAIFDNDSKLDFYFSEENNWIIWSNILDQDQQKIVEYHFLQSTISIEEWLSSIKPLASSSQ